MHELQRRTKPLRRIRTVSRRAREEFQNNNRTQNNNRADNSNARTDLHAEFQLKTKSLGPAQPEPARIAASPRCPWRGAPGPRAKDRPRARRRPPGRSPSSSRASPAAARRPTSPPAPAPTGRLPSPPSSPSPLCSPLRSSPPAAHTAQAKQQEQVVGNERERRRKREGLEREGSGDLWLGNDANSDDGFVLGSPSPVGGPPARLYTGRDPCACVKSHTLNSSFWINLDASRLQRRPLDCSCNKKSNPVIFCADMVIYWSRLLLL